MSKNRAQRVAAKEVPHRKEGRVHSARSDIKHNCESILSLLKHNPLHAPAKADISAAVSGVVAQVNQIGVGTQGARALLDQLSKETAHLASAETWLTQAQRVHDRLGASKSARALEEASENVLGLLRRGDLDGALVSAVASLREAVKGAEVEASRSA